MQVKALPILLLSLCSYSLYGTEKCTPNEGNHCKADGTCEVGYTLSPGTKIVSCIPTEVAPELRPYSAIISPNTKLIISVEDLTSGVGNNRLTDKYLVVSTTPTSDTHGKVTHTAEKITYVPEKNYIGKAKFNFKLKNDKDEVSNESTISVLISNISEPPSAGSYDSETKENTPIKITIDEMKSVIGAADPNDTFTFYSVRLTKDTHGTVEKEKKYLVYTPDEEFHGGASFNYIVKDAAGQISNQAAINITVTAVDQNAVADVYTTKTNKNTVLIVHVTDLTTDIKKNNRKNDVYARFYIDSATPTADTHGRIVADSTTITYIPADDFVGDAAFEYKVKDAAGLVSNSSTIKVKVLETNVKSTLEVVPNYSNIKAPKVQIE